ncbi:DgyrCDS13989 [Dimorphilus gyrociliatus]|uniref:DgyrCDS13989 n=1 Tax=Dimorphilus gyrociliatus TaxID=2664684 RepID=A0A7I8WC72_9ANNE|nr:DgyrCDS13989 [Dimorphilus gyrociliatus]
MEAYRLRRPRKTGLPHLGQNLTTSRENTQLSIKNEKATKNVPFRLPSTSKVEQNLVWSRHGFISSEESDKELKVVIKRMKTKPTDFVKLARIRAAQSANFKNAVITPIPPQSQMEDSLIRNCNTPRVPSPAKSAQSIHWTLPAQKQILFDRKGKTRSQGPYSREFSMTCSPPSIWMKMKWTPRSKTVIY